MSTIRPFIPKRPSAAKSVYSAADYTPDGQLRADRLKEVPLGEKYDERRATMQMSQQDKPKSKYAEMASNVVETFERGSSDDADVTTALARQDRMRRLEQEDAAAHKPAPKEERRDIMPRPPGEHCVGHGKYDVATPDKFRAPHQSQYIAVVRTVENRHPDEDRILQHFFLQYVARQNGTYNPMEDEPVIMRDLLPTLTVVIDRVFSFDDVQGDGYNRLQKYVKNLAMHTDMDVVPVPVNQAFWLPWHPESAFEHKHTMLNQLMHEWHEAHQESASDILARIERDREGKPAAKTPWHIYDGVSEQGAFGPQSKVSTLENVTGQATKSDSWADAMDEADAEKLDDDENEEEWTTVTAKPKKTPMPVRGRAQPRRSQKSVKQK